MVRDQEEGLPATSGEGAGSPSKENGSDIAGLSGKHDAEPGPDTGQKPKRFNRDD